MFEDEIIIRNERIDNVDKWYWLKHDTGAWDGPKHDWQWHKIEYFRNIKKYDVVVQAGGCLGMYPRLLSDMFKTVYTFEPDPLNFYCLNLNCQKDNIIKFNCALGAEPSMATLNRRWEDNVGMHCVVEDSTATYPIIRLDDLALPACDIICLDVEGYETRVILGATNTIMTHRPVVVCENGNQTIYNALRAFGYDTQSQSASDTIYIPKDDNV